MRSRFKRMIRKNAFLCIRLNSRMKREIRHNQLDDSTRFLYAYKFLQKYLKDMYLKVQSTGLEYLNADLKGALIVSNHQGRDDCAIILSTLKEYPSTFVIDEAKSHAFVFDRLCDFLHAKRLRFDDLKSQLVLYNEMAEEIKAGRRFVLFPEAGYVDNKNNMREFHTPCFAPALKSKCPIIPVCIYDTWKVDAKEYQNKNTLVLECHILQPILYEEYQELNKKQLSDLVKSRIETKLNELKKEKNEW